MQADRIMNEYIAGRSLVWRLVGEARQARHEKKVKEDICYPYERVCVCVLLYSLLLSLSIRSDIMTHAGGSRCERLRCFPSRQRSWWPRRWVRCSAAEQWTHGNQPHSADTCCCTALGSSSCNGGVNKVSIRKWIIILVNLQETINCTFHTETCHYQFAEDNSSCYANVLAPLAKPAVRINRGCHDDEPQRCPRRIHDWYGREGVFRLNSFQQKLYTPWKATHFHLWMGGLVVEYTIMRHYTLLLIYFKSHSVHT